MKINKIQILQKTTVLEIENFYSEKELQDIMQELRFLNKNNKFKPPLLTGTAYENNLPKKKNNGVFLDEVYADRSMSDILINNRKLFKINVENLEPIYDYIKDSNTDSTLISYYENSDYYKSHIDLGYLTAVTYFYEMPKSFKGGDLYFPDLDLTLECKHNTLYIFPSFTLHEVKPISMQKKNLNKGMGRYCMTQFLSKRV